MIFKSKRKAFKRYAAIFIGEDRIVIQPNDSGSYGGYVAGSPVRTLAHASSVETILDEIERAFADCKESTGIVSDPWLRVKPLLVATGEKTWHAVSRSFAYVCVIEDGGEMTFSAGIPEKGSFMHRSEADWRCKRKNHKDVIAAFREAAGVAIEAQNLANPPPLS